MIVTMCWTKFL